MVTRLRSDKGSFVQSPFKAFDTEAAVFSGIVLSVIDVPNFNAFFTTPGCANGVANNPQYPNGIFVNSFEFDPLVTPPSATDIITGTFTGVTSGTSWSMSDENLSPFCATALSQRYTDFSVPIAWPAPNTDRRSWQVMALWELQATPPNLEVQYNYGMYPGTTWPTFIQGENFIYTQ